MPRSGFIHFSENPADPADAWVSRNCPHLILDMTSPDRCYLGPVSHKNWKGEPIRLLVQAIWLWPACSRVLSPTNEVHNRIQRFICDCQMNKYLRIGTAETNVEQSGIISTSDLRMRLFQTFPSSGPNIFHRNDLFPWRGNFSHTSAPMPLCTNNPLQYLPLVGPGSNGTGNTLRNSRLWRASRID